jgi:hypothetical protein
MTNEELNAKVYRKASEDQAIFKYALESSSPNEILFQAYKYAVRCDILFALEDLILSDTQCKVLLECHDLIDEIYYQFLKIDNDYMDTIRDSVRVLANNLIRKENNNVKAD